MPTFPLLRERHAWLALGMALLLLVAVVWGVSRFVGWDTVAATAARIAAPVWLAFALLMALSYATRAVRLWRLLHDLDARVRVVRAAPVFFVHNALVTFLPARIGEAAMPLLARRWVGADWAATLGALAWWRVTDLAVVAALALALLATGATVLAPLYALALAACALPIVAVALRGAILHFVERHARHNAEARWARLTRRVLAGMPARLRAVVADLALALLAWTSKLAAFGILIHGALLPTMPISPPLPLLTAAGLAGDLSSALPLPTLGGVGPFEAGVVLGLGALDVDARTALAIGVTLHGAVLVSIVATGALGLALGLWSERRAARHAPLDA